MKKYYIIFAIGLVLVLSGCSTASSSNSNENTNNTPVVEDDFQGKAGQELVLENGQVEIDESLFESSKALFFNTVVKDKTVYYFVVKDADGLYRAAANACQVCHEEKLGFRQQGEFMVCNTCGSKYPLAKIATEKGGCNPVPINPDLDVVDGKVVIIEKDLRQIIPFF
jgi:uncharacterized membrane protein